MAKLAIKGGNKVRTKPFPNQLETILNSEALFNIEENISGLLKDKVFSRYRGNASPNFWGGEYVKAVEKTLGEKIGNKNVLAVNSCTSALYIACAAIGLRPGDEVIVTPWSMSCSATIPLLFGAIPVFADIEYDNFCIDPDRVAEMITPKTKAIIAVDLFGQPADYERLMQIAIQNGIYVIEDAAQAIGSYVRPAKYSNEVESSTSERMYSGTFGHIGCYSFTQGKHFTAGEGGAIVTCDERLFQRCALIRNHAESIINDLDGLQWNSPPESSYLQGNLGLVGGNFRMTDLQAIILIEQLENWDYVMDIRKNNVNRLKEIQRQIPYIEFAKPRLGVEHSYYVMPFYFKHEDIKRDAFLAAVRAELTEEKGRVDRGIPIGGGYIKPLYLFPLFQTKQNPTIAERDYKKGDCPVCEYLWQKEFFLTLYHGLPLNAIDCDDIIAAFVKVYENIDEIME